MSWAMEIQDSISWVYNDQRFMYDRNRSAREQLEMANEIEVACDHVASSGLPVFLMGKKQIFSRIEGIALPEHAELIENLASWNNYHLEVKHSGCLTTFYISTIHTGHADAKLEILYGLKDAYEVGKEFFFGKKIE